MPMVLKSFTNHVRAWRDSIRRAIAVMLLDRAPDALGEFEDAILFVRWDAKLGDTVVLSWVWRELKKHRPDLKLWVTTGADFFQLFEHTFEFDKVVLSPKRPGVWSVFKIAKKLKKPRYVVHLSQTLKARDLLLLYLIRPEHVAGLDDCLKCVDIKLGAVTKDRHFSEKPVPLLENLSVPVDNRRYWLPENKVARRHVMSYWPEIIVIGFCPFGASRHRSFSDLKIVSAITRILAIAAKQGLTVSVFIIATPDKKNSLIDLLKVNDLSSKVFLHPTLDLNGFFEQVRACQGVVSVDTSVVHVAAGFDKPLLAIYNPPDLSPLITSNNYDSWHPNSDQAITFLADSVAGTRIDAFDDARFDAALEKLISKIRVL
jgi:ADP-heptose:LPS heptosyltransferase